MGRQTGVHRDGHDRTRYGRPDVDDGLEPAAAGARLHEGNMAEMEAGGLAVRVSAGWWRPTRAADTLIRGHRAVEARKRVEGKRKARAGRHDPATSRARWTAEA